MGARASRRRHEGRAIRKQRREMGDVGHAIDRVNHKIDAIAQGFMAFGKAAEKMAESASKMFTAFEVGYPGVIAMRDERDGSVTLGVDLALPYPPQSGVKDGREALSAAERVDATAAKMGLELTPWQRELAIATVAGIPMQVQYPKRGGKVALGKVVEAAHQRGPDAHLGWVDEAAELP